jgi:hypothetical protein
MWPAKEVKEGKERERHPALERRSWALDLVVARP